MKNRKTIAVATMMVIASLMITGCGKNSNPTTVNNAAGSLGVTTGQSKLPDPNKTTAPNVNAEPGYRTMPLSPFGTVAISKGLSGKKTETLFKTLGANEFHYTFTHTAMVDGAPRVSKYNVATKGDDLYSGSTINGKEEIIVLYKNNTGVVLTPILKRALTLDAEGLTKRSLNRNVYKLLSQIGPKMALTKEGTEAFLGAPATFEEFTTDLKEYVRYYFDANGKMLGHVTANIATPTVQQIVTIDALSTTVPASLSFAIPAGYDVKPLPKE